MTKKSGHFGNTNAAKRYVATHPQLGVVEFTNLSHFARLHGIPESTVRYNLELGRVNTRTGFRFYYAEEYLPEEDLT